MFVAMAKSNKDSDVTRALELGYERDRLATMIVLGGVSYINLSSLEDVCQKEYRKKVINIFSELKKTKMLKFKWS